MILRDIDAEYDELMDELEKAVNAHPAERGELIQVVRRRVEELLLAQMGSISRPLRVRRTGPDALN